MIVWVMGVCCLTARRQQNGEATELREAMAYRQLMNTETAVGAVADNGASTGSRRNINGAKSTDNNYSALKHSRILTSTPSSTRPPTITPTPTATSTFDDCTAATNDSADPVIPACKTDISFAQDFDLAAWEKLHELELAELDSSWQLTQQRHLLHQQLPGSLQRLQSLSVTPRFLQEMAPTEMLEEIFSWIPPILVGKCRTMCHRFNDSLCNPVFIRLNTHRALGTLFTSEIARLSNLNMLELDKERCALSLLPPSYWPLYTEIAFASLESVHWSSNQFQNQTNWFLKDGEKRFSSKSLLNQMAEVVFSAPGITKIHAYNLFWRHLDTINKLSRLTELNFVTDESIEIPNIKCIKNIVNLTISGSNVTGKISADIAQMSNLRIFSLAYCSQVFFESLNALLQLENLTELNLCKINFTGVQVSRFWVLKKLVKLNLSFCGMEGSLGDGILHMTALSALNLSNNSITGEIPSDLGNFLENLVSLDLSHNRLCGRVPVSILVLSSITNLDVAQNRLTGIFNNDVGAQRTSFATQ
ncbi:hypothetical protein HK100_007164 [Physocladia obscura]|uniref:F-box domain-containing protein n=1 Tax=Physocladia obscura TaxID=109957 RepID=A0AAD5SPP5_9FUNG|nr:hypothetical protein HK100_007164 [Physocladia obscura]